MMHRLGVALAMVAVLGTAACGSGHRAATLDVSPVAPPTDASRSELSFLIGMIPHHAQAVDMAGMGLTRTHDVRVLQLCRRIIEAQSREIAEMRRWAVAWYATVPSEVVSALHSAEGAAGEGGMLKDEEMHGLAAMTGRAFDLEFFTRMIAHHRGAVASAELIRDLAPHTEVRRLAAGTIATQRAEIGQMSAWARGAA